jgi:hypothetical protein
MKIIDMIQRFLPSQQGHFSFPLHASHKRIQTNPLSAHGPFLLAFGRKMYILFGKSHIRRSGHANHQPT